MTIERKAALVSGHDVWTTQPVDDDETRSVTLSDGPHGLRVQAGTGDALGMNDSRPATCFPPAVAVGSSWDPEVAARLAAALAVEARALGVDVVLGPGVNIKRSPLCGRNFEYFSEDPLLSGVLGAAYVRAMQDNGVGASVKHFAANNQETDRMRVDATVDERTLREIYLPAFERIVRTAQPATVMCAYNRLNGFYGSEHRWLLTEVLRNEWGFTGAVVSDWGAVHDPVAAVRAGVDLEMPGTSGRSATRLAEAVRSGELDGSVLDAAATRVRALDPGPRSPGAAFDAETHHALAVELATRCAVLLKNDGTLPLSADTSIAVVGEFARTPRYQGGGSSRVKPTRVDSPLEALSDHATGVLHFVPGFTLDGSGDAAALRDAAVIAAAAADVALVFAGLPEQDESEGFDRTSIDLPDVQVALIKAVAAVAPKTVVVLANGGIVSLEGWHDDVDAVLEGFLLGQGVGTAVADLLYGVANPSGKLAETIPLRLADSPSHLTFPGEQGRVVYGERVFVGYRGLTTTGTPVRYPFGHGLSYTTFTTSGFTVEVTGADTARVALDVTNTGERDGTHVVQLYVDASDAGSPVARPRRELRAFRAVFLRAGETIRVEFALDHRAFAYWDAPLGRWLVTPGAYTVQLGRDASTIEAQTTIELAGEHVVRELTLGSTVQEWFDHPAVGPTLLDDLDSDLARAVTAPDVLRMIGSVPMQKLFNLLGDAVPAGFVQAALAKSRSHSPEVSA